MVEWLDSNSITDALSVLYLNVRGPHKDPYVTVFFVLSITQAYLPFLPLRAPNTDFQYRSALCVLRVSRPALKSLGTASDVRFQNSEVYARIRT